MEQEKTVQAAEETCPAKPSSISAYIRYEGKCREAFEFYRDCIGGELSFLTWAESPMADRCPLGKENEIMHAMLWRDNIMLMGTDMNPGTALVNGNNFSLCFYTGNEKELHECFEKLSAGGQVIDPPGEKFWGDIFGVLVDKYGIAWMFNCDKSSN